jgi:hypothetical protein
VIRRTDTLAEGNVGRAMDSRHFSQAVSVVLAFVIAGCGRSTDRPDPGIEAARAGSRPLGVGPRFHPPSPTHAVGDCRPALGRRDGAHLELFAADRVVLFPAGIGTEPPRRTEAGRIRGARCYGSLVTLEPTGLVLVRAGERRTLGDFFATWGKPLTRGRAADFTGHVRAYVGGRPWRADPAAIPLRRHAVIVLEIGPFVPPHRSYVFPPGT